MASEQIKGTVGKVAGKAEAVVGEWLDDEQLQARGMAREAAGQLQEKYGRPWTRALAGYGTNRC